MNQNVRATNLQYPYRSQTWDVEVRESIAREFTAPDGFVDDNLAGLHEVRVRMWEKAGKDMKNFTDMIRWQSTRA